MVAEHDIRRNSDGSIDTDFYKARAGCLRQAARIASFSGLWRGALDALKSLDRRRAGLIGTPSPPIGEAR